MVVKIEITGLDDVIKFATKLPKELEIELNKGNERFMKNLRRTAKFKAPRSSGETARGLKIERTKTKGATKQYKLVSTSPHTIFIIEGRAPGKAPPVQEIMKWNKLSTQKSGQKSRYAAALKLAKWIGRHGTRPNDFVGRALEHNLNKLNSEMADSINKAITKSK